MPRSAPILAVLAAAAALSLGFVCASAEQQYPPDSEPEARLTRQTWEEQVKPLVDGRCVVCHGCYDSPCQLNLAAPAGVERGASKEPVYGSGRLGAMDPTRLFIDAHSPDEWRQRGFFSVRDEEPASLLARMLNLGRAHPPTAEARLPDDLPLDINRRLSCPTAEEFGDYAEDNPLGGMPYGVAALPDDEFTTLDSWARLGAPVPATRTGAPEKTRRTVARWEKFLNGDSLREQLVSRYLYEHLFLAHLTFDAWPEGPYFRLVRSRTPPGQPVDEIATVRPTDDPGVERPWYRLEPVHGSILHKTHIVYVLGDGRMKRLRELFLKDDWQVVALPSYEADVATNPFVSFAAIPSGARYQFLLDDAHYFIMTFIRGPVCRGQVAVDVIQDHFFVTFLDPDIDPSVTQPSYLEEAKSMLALPAAAGSKIEIGNLWLDHNEAQVDYGELRERYFDALDPERRGPSLDWLWDGDGHNPNAYLTVFRNFDNATVLQGFVGDVPKTAWVIDFPILERIYYNLVAGFDVFGNFSHQMSTRLYMDHLRMQSENNFLAFLPADDRKTVRESWYVGAERQVTYFVTNQVRSLEHGTQVSYRTNDPKSELIEMILARAGELAGPPDTLNRCSKPPCDFPGASAGEREVERSLQPLSRLVGAPVAALPDITVVRVKTGERSLLYALVHDKMHDNVAFMFGEDERRRPDQDRLTLIRGPFGSYPSFVFEVPEAEVPAFVTALSGVKDDASLSAVADRWGVRRTSARFWETVDWLHAEARRWDPMRAGLYDLNRYGNL